MNSSCRVAQINLHAPLARVETMSMFLVCFDEQLCVCTRCRLWRITGIILSGEHDQPDWLAQWEKLMQAQSSAKGGCCFRNKTLAWQN